MEKNNPYIEEINKVFAELSQEVKKLGDEYTQKIKEIENKHKK